MTAVHTGIAQMTAPERVGYCLNTSAPGAASTAPELAGQWRSDVGERTCSIEGCDRPLRCRALCGHHYDKARRAGLPTRVHDQRPLEVRFWESINKTDGCWEWTGSRNEHNYGWLLGRGAHRASWEVHFGPIPKGLWVLHRCDNPPCVRPDHLFLGTQADNIEDMWRKGRGALPPTMRGDDNGNSKLRSADVIEIRARVAAGEPRWDVARDKGISKVTLDKVVSRRAWKHVP